MCVVGKQQRAPLPKQARRRAKHSIELVHGDICCLVSPPTPSGIHYFLLLVDRHEPLHVACTPSQQRPHNHGNQDFRASVEVKTG
jgi:hypothetical protein